ncbi:uncharacterized protein [Phaenicophaeus curvirostris]|uniref:uncharacterized protein n=1 Tax=Phaenicophaeus curvirostris TaxID=33595 RepID=UPI0037F0EF69
MKDVEPPWDTAPARRTEILLLDLTEDLEHSNADVVVKALLILQNILGHLKKKEASSIAVQLVEKLLPFFHHGQGQVKEQAIRFFTEQQKSVVWSHKGDMKDKVQTALFLLFAHLRDETPSVSEASRECLLAAAKFLGWKLPKDIMKPKLPWLVGDRWFSGLRSSEETDQRCGSLQAGYCLSPRLPESPSYSCGHRHEKEDHQIL